jgi:hypothetical protein
VSRGLWGAFLAGLLAAAVGCTSTMKKDASFVFGETHKTEGFLDHDCWKQLDAKDSRGTGGQPPRADK